MSAVVLNEVDGELEAEMVVAVPRQPPGHRLRSVFGPR